MSVHRCCLNCGEPNCCNVTGPAWANRYCFQMSGYEATYEFKECRYSYVDPECGPRYCEDVPEPGADTDAKCEENSEVCHRRQRVTACASGAVFRGLISIPGSCGCTGSCLTSCPDGPPNSFGDPACMSWYDVYNQTGALLYQGVCDKPTWVPPDVSTEGCDSLYASPPCDCAIAGNDRASAKGIIQDLDLTGFCMVPGVGQPPCDSICVAMDEVDEPYECLSSAVMRCKVDNGICPPNTSCSAPYQSSLRRHQFVIYVGSECEDCSVGLGFTFEADLGPGVPPDQAVWTCVSAPAYCQGEVCEEENCGETYPDDPCGLKSCDDWEACYTNSDNPECNGQDINCRGCVGPSTLVLPTLTFTSYQNCTYAEGC